MPDNTHLTVKTLVYMGMKKDPFGRSGSQNKGRAREQIAYFLQGALSKSEKPLLKLKKMLEDSKPILKGVDYMETSDAPVLHEKINEDIDTYLTKIYGAMEQAKSQIGYLLDYLKSTKQEYSS